MINGKGIFFLFPFLCFASVAIHRCVYSTEWQKFRTCNDVGFCRRHRALARNQVTDEDVYVVVQGSARSEDGSIKFDVKRKVSEDNPSLILKVSRLERGIFKVIVEDVPDKVRFERYRVPDIIIPGQESILDSDVVTLKEPEYKTVISNGGDETKLPKLVVTYDPFTMAMFSESDERMPASIVLNSHSLLKYEQQYEKPTPNPQIPEDYQTNKDLLESTQFSQENTDNTDDSKEAQNNSEVEALKKENEIGCDGCWEEVFKGKSDPKVRGPESIGLDISFPSSSHVYGIPEHAHNFSLPSTKAHGIKSGDVISEPFRLFNLDVFEFELEKPFGLYGSVPFMIAHGGPLGSCGVLWLNAAETYVDIAKRENGGIDTHWYSETGVIEIYLLPGNSPKDVFGQYRFLTGTPSMPPKFSLAYHQCRWNYRDEQDVNNVDAEFDNHDIPYDVIWLDIEHTDGKRYFTWDETKFPNPTEMMSKLADKGRKLVTIVDPHIKRDPNYIINKDATENGYYVKKADGQGDFDGWCWPGSSSYYDYFNEAARKAWGSKFNNRDYPHFSANHHIWVDMNEPSVFSGPEGTFPLDLKHAGGIEHRHVHNMYGIMSQKATFEGLVAARENKVRPFLLVRSYYAGSQRYGAVWTGDNLSSWEHLRSSIPMIFSNAVAGIIFIGADIGGFFGNPSSELLIRWYQVGAFQPFFRAHAHLDTSRREPWLFGEDVKTHISKAVEARYEYIPYWYTLFAAVHYGDKLPCGGNSDSPPMRPLWWEYPNDEPTYSIEDQWLVGNALLVAPIMHPGATSREVYLPGTDLWYDIYGKKGVGKRNKITISATLDRMVVFQKGGTIIPKQERKRRNTKMQHSDPYTLVVALDSGSKASGLLYGDDGESYDHEKGHFSLSEFTFSKDVLEMSRTIGEKSSFEGADAEIERVVILGWSTKNKVKEINVTPDRSQPNTRHHATFMLIDDCLIIKKPDVQAFAKMWRIEIK